jgi:hypothetical protein
MGGGGHAGGMGGGMHAAGMAGGMHPGGTGGGASFAAIGGGSHFAGTGAGPHFGGARFAGAPFAHGGVGPRFSRFGFHDRDRFHHRFRSFAFFDGGDAYADYDSCWRTVWTSYGPQRRNLCSGYGYY